MGGGGGQGISEQVQWEEGKKKISSQKRNSGVDYSEKKKKGSMSTLSNYKFSQNRSYFFIFLSSVLCIV